MPPVLRVTQPLPSPITSTSTSMNRSRPGAPTRVASTYTRAWMMLAAVGSTLPTYHLFGLDLGNLGNKVLDVPIGMYTITVESRGFARARIEPQELTINQALRVDVSLKLGAANETVEVLMLNE